MTDEFRVYTDSNLLYKHQLVKHAEAEYVTGNAHTNGIESFYSYFERRIFGVNHHVSVKHLQKIVKEYGFRYNFREMKEGERVDHMLS